MLSDWYLLGILEMAGGGSKNCKSHKDKCGL